MIKWFIHRKLRDFERTYRYDASYMHEVLEADPTAFLKFMRATGVGAYRKDVPVEVWTAASLTSSVQADCGPCTQLGVGFALEAGVAPGTVAAIIRGDVVAMSAEVALGVRFARAVLARDAAADECREEIQRRWGTRAVIALAYRIMGAQLYPTLKYALGHGKACTRVVIAGEAVAPARQHAVVGAA